MNSKDNKVIPLEWYSIFGVLVLVGLIYSPVVTNSFNGDDFVHLKWLHQAVSQPELIWRNFHSSWLDLTTAKFYRPLISVFMMTDYLVWHNNGIGFHLTNILCHLANTLLVWLILKTVIAEQYTTKSSGHYMWCISAAALFGLYPLHTEAVDWITGRVDPFVTLFFLSGFFAYLCWRRYNKYKWLCFSIIAFVCSLLCKEMAIVLPPVIFMYELIFGYEGSSNSAVKAMVLAIKRSAVFWAILVGYFLWRGYALGTLVGGYDSTFLPLQNWRLLVYLWKHSLYMFFIPFNQSLLTNGKSIIILWAALLLLSLVLCIKQVSTNKESRLIFIFLCSWLVLSLVPVYKLFNIGADLQGSRLAYLATVPLSMLICFGLSAAIRRDNKIASWQIAILVILISAAGAGLLVNNSAWIRAGAASRALVDQLNELSKTKAANTVIYIIGLPDQINGAYVCRNALDGMTKYPQITADINNCFNLSEIDHIFPFGYALRSMTNVTSGSSIPEFYAWRPDQEKLEQFNLPVNPPIPLDKGWSGENIKSDIPLYVSGKPCTSIDFLVIDYRYVGIDEIDPRTLREQGRIASAPTNSSDIVVPTRAQQASPLHEPSLYTNIAPTQTLRKPRPDTNLIPAHAKSLHKPVPYIVYKNDLHPEGIRMSALPAYKQGKMIFPLHGQVDWALGGKCSKFELRFSPDYADQITIKSAAVVPASKIMPILSFKGTANQNIIGYVELDKSHPSCEFNYDATKMNEVKNVIMELTPPNQNFGIPNDPTPGMPGLAPSPIKLSGLSGTILLTKANFPELGIYALRLRAVGENNKYIGVAGDHIIITVR